MLWDRALVGLAALAGLSGVALAAVAAHVTGPGNLETASQFLLFHAPVLLAVPALGRLEIGHASLGRVAAAAIALGLALFCGDLAVRALLGAAPVFTAAPTGGIVLMLGWAMLGVAALVGGREREPRL